MKARETLVVFDIDGTLLHSDGAHNDLITVVQARHGLDATIKPFGSYSHYTDWCVIDEVHQATHGVPVPLELVSRLNEEYREAFVEHLGTTDVDEVAGAGRLLRELDARPDVHVAFATGSLRGMAEVKLGLVGVDATTAALSTSSEGYSREEIVRGAVAQVAERIGHRDLDLVILGDGAWDERTAAGLGIAFVGLTTGSHVFGGDTVRTMDDFSELSAADLLSLARPWTDPQSA